MLVDLVVPLEQEGTKAVVLGWLKALGDPVAADEAVVELETDKVAVEVAAPGAGVLAGLILAKDAEATPGAVLRRIRTGDGAVATPAPLASARRLHPPPRSHHPAPRPV